MNIRFLVKIPASKIIKEKQILIPLADI